MNEKIYQKMIKWRKENGAKKAFMTAKEWSSCLEMTITPQRMTSMVTQGLLERHRDRRYYGDNNYRYDVILMDIYKK